MDLAWIALSLLPHVGIKTLQALIETFGSPQAVLDASAADLRQVRGVGVKIAASIQAVNLANLEQNVKGWQQAGIGILVPGEAAYPEILLQLDDYPAILFVRGSYPLSQFRQAVALVGTRNASAQGRSAALHLAASLAQQGWIIVSGLALGIDTAAHQGALSVPGAVTLAVTGSGVLNLYPPQNRALAQAILQRGAILSENHPQATASAPNLVSRNRIISGLCRHVILVESEATGGAMYATETALHNERRLHVVDLPISGNQLLIGRGALPIAPDVTDFCLD
jgi:DNA processing protein